MKRRPVVIEVAWGKRGSGNVRGVKRGNGGKWYIMVGWQGMWIQCDEPYRTKREVLKAATAVAKEFRHPECVWAALQAAMKERKRLAADA